MPLIKPTSEEEEKKPTEQSEAMQIAETAEPDRRPEGLVTQVGEGLRYMANVDGEGYMADVLNAGAAAINAVTPENFPTKNFTQNLDDSVLGSEEMKAVNQERAPEMTGVVKNLDAVSSGLEAGIALPFTGAGRLLNQRTPWNERPASIADDDPTGQIIFDVTRVLAPTLLTGGVAGAGGIPGGLATESAIETVMQDSADEMMGGRWLAGKLGELTDDPELTRELIEGDTPRATAILSAYGFAQNYGINWSFGKLFEYFPQAKKAFGEFSERIGGIVGKPQEAVEDSLTDFMSSEYLSDLEPAAQATLDTIVPTPRAPEGGVINQEALLQKALRETEGLPHVESSNNFFTNWSALSPDIDAQTLLMKVFDEVPEFEPGPVGRTRAILGTTKWLTENLSLLDEAPRKFLEQYAKDFGTVINRSGEKLSSATIEQTKNLEGLIKTVMGYSLGTEEGITAMFVGRYLAEDLGRRLVRASEQLDNMLVRGEDITSYMENVYLPLENYTQAILFPFRRGKRAFNLIGEAQQGRYAEEVKKIMEDPQVAQGRVDDLVKRNVAPRGVEEIEELIEDGVPTGETIKSLWEAWKEGDQDAGKLLKNYIRTMRYGDANKVLSESQISKQAIAEQIKGKRATERFFYNVLTLGQFGTQINAAVPTVFRQALEPLALVGSPNLKDIGFKERLAGIGQFYGGIRYTAKAWDGLFRALVTNKPGAGYSKYARKHNDTLMKEVKELKKLHASYQAELAENGASWGTRLAAYTHGLYQIAGYHPITGLATRGLMATDEGARITTGVQIAEGRAFQRMAEMGSLSPRQLKEFEQEELAKIFEGDPSRAIYRDTPEGLAAKAVADKISLQKSLDVDENSNALMKFFAAEDNAAKMSPIHRFFSPFMRVAGNAIEQELENLSATAFPGSQLAMGRLPGFKRYKELYEAADDTQKLQLESQMALAQWLGMTTVFGLLAGTIAVTPDQRGSDKTSIIVKGGADGRDVSISYDKFSPFGTPLNNIATVVKEFESGAITHGQYASALGNIIFGWAAFSLNKSVLQGQQQLQRLLNYQAGAEPWLLGVIDSAALVISPGIGREFFSLLDPYQPIKEERTSFGARVADGILNKTTASAGNPPAYDIYARKPEDTAPGRTAGYSGDNQRWKQLAGMFYPGNIVSTRYTDPVISAMRQSKFEVRPDFTRKIFNAELTKDQQSELRYHMQGTLYDQLAQFTEGRGDYTGNAGYPKMWKAYKKYLKEEGTEGPNTMRQLQKINETWQQIHFEAKLRAAELAGFADDPIIQQEIQKAKDFYQPRASARQGMYATAANQSTELASQVREILDIPV